MGPVVVLGGGGTLSYEQSTPVSTFSPPPLRSQLLGSEERRRQNTHRASLTPHADRCAVAQHGVDALRRLRVEG